jgi:hypothetical protein
MSGTIKLYQKTAVEKRRLYLDYSCWLEESETLTGFQTVINPVTPDGPLRMDVSYPDVEHTKLMVFASGGVPNQNYVVSMIVNTTAGQIKRDDIGIKVLP